MSGYQPRKQREEIVAQARIEPDGQARDSHKEELLSHLN